MEGSIRSVPRSSQGLQIHGMYRARADVYRPVANQCHQFWTDESSRDFIAKEYSDFLETYDSYPYTIQRADVIRYFVLVHYGGTYIDLDDVHLLSQSLPLISTNEYCPGMRSSHRQSQHLPNLGAPHLSHRHLQRRLRLRAQSPLLARSNREPQALRP